MDRRSILLGGVGLFEMGKHTLMMQSSYDFE
jgi:hypothetical protein